MEQPPITQYTISDFAEWQLTKQLELAPRFQRRPVWPEKAKSYFIDTVLRGLPCPPLFIRATIDPSSMRSVREVVDGQQRLRTVLGYMQGEFPLSRVHNEEYGGATYVDLPQEVQRDFLGYRFVVELLEDVSDADVLGLFARFNTNTVRLNTQELRNARYFGVFKQLAYGLALAYYAFWRSNKVLNDRQIARMQDAELVSELLLTMSEGIRSTRSSDLDALYDRYEDEMPQRDEFRERFEAVMNLIGGLFEDPGIWKTFRRRAPFFSLFVAIYDARYSLPGSHNPRIRLTSAKVRELQDRLAEFAREVEASESEDALAFQLAVRTSTTDPSRRRQRHDLIWSNVLADLA